MLDALAFATGAALCAMLGTMQLRADRTRERASGYLLLWVLGFIWTFGNFVRCVLDLAGTAPDSKAALLAETFAWSCTLIGPITIGRLLQGAIGTTSRVSRGFLAFTVAISLLSAVLLVRADYLYAWRLEASGYPATSFYIALVVDAIAVALYIRERPAVPRRVMPRWFLPAACLFAAVHITAILVSMLPPRIPRGLMATAELIARHWTIPWAILIAASLAQAHYADLVLKRCLWLLASVTAATLVGLFVIRAAPGLPLLVTVLATAASMLAAPSLLRALDATVDQAILARPDYTEASRALDHAFRRATHANQLIDAALDSLRHTLHVEARWIADTRRLEISATHQARTLMQRELGFLDSVRLQLDHRLEALRFEEEQRALHLREERLKRLLSEAELKALRTQVDPHFLFNTLNTIADSISTNPGQAERMTERLAECFRYALAKHSRNLSTLDEELDFARHYLEIEQVRFGDRLRVQLSRGDAVGTEEIPSLLLQPLLENAIRHGLAPVREGGCVSVNARRDGECLHLSVEDDGVGLRAGAPAGVGLRNVQQRLQTLYSQAAQFVIAARRGGRGTVVTLVIPLHAH